MMMNWMIYNIKRTSSSHFTQITTVEKTEQKDVFSCVLNDPSDASCLMPAGRFFQAVGLAVLKAPNQVYRVG